MSDIQFEIMFVMALVFVVANDMFGFIGWYILYSESLTVTWMSWDEWTFIYMVFYVTIRMLAVRFGWQTRGRMLGGKE